MTASYVTAEMRAAVGRQLWRAVSFPVAESDIRRWAIAVYYPDPPPPEYLAAGDASGEVPGDAPGQRPGRLAAPAEFNPFAWLSARRAERPGIARNDPGRVEKLLGIAHPPLGSQLNGGLEARYGEPVRAGDVITSVATLDGYTERRGRLGPMLFTVTRDTWTNQEGQLVKVFRATSIRYGDTRAEREGP